MALEKSPRKAPVGTHRGTHRRPPFPWRENRSTRKCLAILGKSQLPTAGTQIAPTLTNWAIYLEAKGFGSSGRTRTYSGHHHLGVRQGRQAIRVTEFLEDPDRAVLILVP